MSSRNERTRKGGGGCGCGDDIVDTGDTRGLNEAAGELVENEDVGLNFVDQVNELVHDSFASLQAALHHQVDDTVERADVPGTRCEDGLVVGEFLRGGRGHVVVIVDAVLVAHVMEDKGFVCSIGEVGEASIELNHAFLA